jgi:hypothetical protein
MTEAGNERNGIAHPAPDREQLGAWRLGICLFGAPGAWIAQMLGSEILTGNGCKNDHWFGAHLFSFLTALDLACFIAGVASCLTAWRVWQKTRHENEGEGHHLMNSGEGRTRFLALLGCFSSLIFITAILFTSSALLLVSSCR